MHKFLNTNSLRPSPDAIAAEVLSLGISGIELSLPNEIAPEELKKTLDDANLRIASFIHPDFDLFSLLDPDEAARSQALELGRELIGAAARLNPDGMLTLPAHTRAPAGIKLDDYETALFTLFSQLEQLLREAERVAVRIALENPASGIFLSPLELRQFIDQLNTPWAGIAFNPAYAAALGRPSDWLGILGPRVFALRLPLLPEGLHIPDWICRQIDQGRLACPLIFS